MSKLNYFVRCSKKLMEKLEILKTELSNFLGLAKINKILISTNYDNIQKFLKYKTNMNI